MPLVTFIVPTLGRPSLERALRSLQDQTDPDWEAIVFCDGGDLPECFARFSPTRDERFHWTGGQAGTAGVARNMALAHYEVYSGPETEWFAFLDDDDHLTAQYVEHLREQIEDYPWADVIVSRMKDPRLGILPPPSNPILRHGTVGISFAVRKEVMQNHSFVPEDWDVYRNEDWEMIRSLRDCGHRIHISPHIDYLVRNA